MILKNIIKYIWNYNMVSTPYYYCKIKDNSKRREEQILTKRYSRFVYVYLQSLLREISMCRITELAILHIIHIVFLSMLTLFLRVYNRNVIFKFD